MGLRGTVGDAVVVRTVGAGVGIVGRGVGIVGAGVGDGGIVGLGVGGAINVGGVVGDGGGVGRDDGNGGIAGFKFPEMYRGVGGGVTGAVGRGVVGDGVALITGTGTVGDGVRTNKTGAGVRRVRTVGTGVGTVGAGVGGKGIVGTGVGTVGAGVGGKGIVGDGVRTIVGAGVNGGAAGIIPSDPSGAHGIPGEDSSNFTSHPIHAPGAHVNDIRATSYPVIN